MTRPIDTTALDLGCRLAAGQDLDEALASPTPQDPVDGEQLANIAERVRNDNKAALARQADSTDA